MMHMNTTGVTALAGFATRAVAPGTHSFGAIQNGRVHTAS
jgi:hypothetical protein